MKRVLGFCVLIILLSSTSIRAQEDNVMYAHYINVGQAASVLLEFPCGAVLIDAGAQDEVYRRGLIDFLNKFFDRRKDLNRTLSLLMITHPHIDHTFALKDVASTFRVDHYVDDGLETGDRGNQKWMQGQTITAKIKYETHTFEEITQGGNKTGLTSATIDPVNCPNGDPKIILYSGSFAKQPADWTDDAYDNKNNNSLVVKVTFGQASFLFTGDLQEEGLAKMVETYGTTKALDVDVLMVGHHGAANATTEEYLDLVTPKYAIISCGEWDFGKRGTGQKPKAFTTYAYGHPRISTINMLEEYVPDKRSGTPLRVKAGEGAGDFRFVNIDKRIYATAWDQTVTIRATTTGTYRVTTNN